MAAQAAATVATASMRELSRSAHRPFTSHHKDHQCPEEKKGSDYEPVGIMGSRCSCRCRNGGRCVERRVDHGDYCQPHLARSPPAFRRSREAGAPRSSTGRLGQAARCQAGGFRNHDDRCCSSGTCHVADREPSHHHDVGACTDADDPGSRDDPTDDHATTDDHAAAAPLDRRWRLRRWRGTR